MNIALAQVDLIAQAVEALEQVDPDLAHDLVDEIITPFWNDFEPMPPVYDGPYGVDNPAPGTR